MSDPSVVEDVLLKALEHGRAEEWVAFLDGACRGDAKLRCEVERLLAAHAKSGEFLAPMVEWNAAARSSPWS